MMMGILVIGAICGVSCIFLPILVDEWRWSSPDDTIRNGWFASYRMWLRKRSLKKNREEPPLLAEILQELRHTPDRCTMMALHMAQENANKAPDYHSPFSPQTAALFEQISRQQQHYFYGPGTVQQLHSTSQNT